MTFERCADCGFDGSAWTDEDALAAVDRLPRRWAQAIDGLTPEDAQRRPVDGTWSIAEYTDHVRETVFAMRFVLDTAVDTPGTELGDAPEPAFEPERRAIDVGELHDVTHHLGDVAGLRQALRTT